MRALRERHRIAPSESPEPGVPALIGTPGRITNRQIAAMILAPIASRHESDVSRSGSYDQTWMRASIQF